MLSSAGGAPLRASLTSITTSERAVATRFLRCRLTALTFMADAGRLHLSVLLIRPHFLTACLGRFTSGLILSLGDRDRPAVRPSLMFRYQINAAGKLRTGLTDPRA